VHVRPTRRNRLIATTQAVDVNAGGKSGFRLQFSTQPSDDERRLPTRRTLPSSHHSTHPTADRRTLPSFRPSTLPNARIRSNAAPEPHLDLSTFAPSVHRQRIPKISAADRSQEGGLPVARSLELMTPGK
jgi:hypothetical protein